MVIAAGYIVEMKDLLAQNPGMESRFPTTLHFADYTAAELMSIAERAGAPIHTTKVYAPRLVFFICHHQ